MMPWSLPVAQTNGAETTNNNEAENKTKLKKFKPRRFIEEKSTKTKNVCFYSDYGLLKLIDKNKAVQVDYIENKMSVNKLLYVKWKFDNEFK